MSAFLGVPVDAAYHVVSALAGILAPLPGGLAATAAIVLVTMAVRLLLLPLSYRAMRGMDAQARIAPQVRALREKHAGRPDALRRELSDLQASEGAGLRAGCLPMLAQWPLLSVMYLLFRSPDVAGAPDTLLRHDLLGAPLGSHWLAGGGPLSAHGAVFAGVFLLLAVIGWLSARIARRAGAGQAAAAGQAGGNGAAGVVTRLAPFVTVAVAAFLPLAAGLYLVTSTAWTLGERTLLRRHRQRGREQEAAGRR